MSLRVGLVLLIGTPGLGTETRTGGDVMGWLYTVTYLADFLALALTWRGRRFAPALAGAVGTAAAVVAAIAIGLVLVPKARPMRPAVA